MSIFNLFSKDKPDLEFIDDSPEGIVYPHYPPVLAKDVKPLKEYQENKYDGEWQFPKCPGMFDYSRMGYIVPAWSNFYIKANKAGHVAFVGTRGEQHDRRPTPIKQPLPMETGITDGTFKIDGVSPRVWNFPGAWKVYGRGNVSALLLPPVYHNPSFLDDLHMYPGVVDYNGFTTINFIVSPKRACEIEIKAGDPVLHVIPLITNKTIVSSYGPPSTREQVDYSKIVKWFHEFNFYRRFYMIRKKYKIFKKVD